MREPFASQPTLDVLPIADVPLNMRGRDEIIPILAALKHLYADVAARDQLLDLIAQDVNDGSCSSCGRPGLSYWQILVLAAVRLGCNLDYDKLQNLAEEHRTLRRIMGIGSWDDDAKEECFDWRRISDNVRKIRPETLEKINGLVVASGHRLEPTAAREVRGDSFVVETNIHHPTDASVLADGLRKVLQLGFVVALLLGIKGWRQRSHLQKRVRQLLRSINQACKSKRVGAAERRKQAYQPLFRLARRVLRRARQLLRDAEAAGADTAGLDLLALQAQVEELQHYVELTEKVADQGRRRVVEEEAVPNLEKTLSIFEPHTELINRGKVPVAIQFGRTVLTIEDRVGFIIHYTVYPRGGRDADQGVPALKQAQEKMAGAIDKASFDRGFHTPANQTEFAKIVREPCVPVRGARQAERQDAEATPAFRRSRRRHPGVESMIGGLQAGNGLERCRDRSEQGFCRYVGLGILGRNLHVLGKLVLAKADPQCQAATSRRQKAAG
jgi:transposase, IS5 family